MEKSYLIAQITPFSTNKTKEIIKQPKIYFIDSGLRNIISKEFNPEFKGMAFENYVLSELIKKGFSPKYWRTKSNEEIDFVIERNSEIIPIEVKITSTDKIEKNIISFIEKYNPKKAFVVFYKGKEKEIDFRGCKVLFVNILSLLKNI